MRCENHPDSPAIGRCVHCRTVICDACATRVQGRNTCASCLRARMKPPGPGDSPLPGVLGTAALGLAGLAGFAVLVAAVLGFGFFVYAAR